MKLEPDDEAGPFAFNQLVKVESEQNCYDEDRIVADQSEKSAEDVPGWSANVKQEDFGPKKANLKLVYDQKYVPPKE